MTDINNKELLLEAIDNYILYTSSERVILKTLVQISIDNIAIVNIDRLHNITRIAKSVIYKSLSTLEKTNAVKILEKSGKINSFKINEPQLEYIIEVYKKTQHLMNKPAK